MSRAGHVPRRVLANPLQTGRLTLDSATSHHLIHVLRLAVGQEVELFDGHGQVAQGSIVSVEGKGPRVTVEVAAVTRQSLRPPRQLHVAVAAPRAERCDSLVEKLTELGVAEISWLLTARTVNRPGAQRIERHLRIAEAAARQCGRATLPAILGPTELDEVVDRLGVAPQEVLIARRDGVPLRTWSETHRSERVLLVVGPEGGFSGDELEAFAKARYTGVALAVWTLRVETAAVVGAGLLLAV